MSKRKQSQRPAPRARAYPSLRAWRKAHGLNQRDAARRLGLTQASYARAELGVVIPRKAALRRVLDETGVPLEVLVGIA